MDLQSQVIPMEIGLLPFLCSIVFTGPPNISSPGTPNNHFLMDVWWNNHFSCKDLESSNWNNHFKVDVSGSRHLPTKGLLKEIHWATATKPVNDIPYEILVGLYLRIFQHTPGTYPRPPTNSLWRNSFHFGLWGCLGYAPGVCWVFLRLYGSIYPIKSPTGSTERTQKQPEYLIARSQLTFHGVRWDKVPFNLGGGFKHFLFSPLLG